jgi:hypothetical protein
MREVVLAAANRSTGNIQDKTMATQIDLVRSDKLAFNFFKDNGMSMRNIGHSMRALARDVRPKIDVWGGVYDCD